MKAIRNTVIIIISFLLLSGAALGDSKEEKLKRLAAEAQRQASYSKYQVNELTEVKAAAFSNGGSTKLVPLTKFSGSSAELISGVFAGQPVKGELGGRVGELSGLFKVKLTEGANVLAIADKLGLDIVFTAKNMAALKASYYHEMRETLASIKAMPGVESAEMEVVYNSNIPR